MIFVFGSNLKGVHGKGAALHAKNFYGAIQGIGEGIQNNSYALPTKDMSILTLPLEEIEKHIIKFIQYAMDNPLLNFNLTPIGCGLAGYEAKVIWRLIQRNKPPSNVYLSQRWMNDHSVTV